MQELPLGISDFKELREKNCVYADRTEDIYSLISGNNSFLLTRPRGFGKTLFLSTLKYIFQGRKELFKGLWIYNSPLVWKPHPIIYLNLGDILSPSNKSLKKTLLYQIEQNAQESCVELDLRTGPRYTLEKLIEKLYFSTNRATGKGATSAQVVVLIDNYDSPILETIHDPLQSELTMRALRNFFQALKNSLRFLRFVILTGMFRYPMRSIFPQFNQIRDISFERHVKILCGITQEDLDRSLAGHVEATWNNFKEMGRYPAESPLALFYWDILNLYNGYSFGNPVKYVNPISVLAFLKNRFYGSFWLESAKPSYLEEIIERESQKYNLMKEKIVLPFRSNYMALGNLETIPLLLQSGYLSVESVKKVKRVTELFLKVPNQEIRSRLLSPR
ncbi:MAG: AAA family ATPase [Deltaproteobacteria bacterium]|jgi:hypothetical protein|nr:AAA family ATPase [Deltaproteobacteria bacterium]